MPGNNKKGSYIYIYIKSFLYSRVDFIFSVGLVCLNLAKEYARFLCQCGRITK